MSMWCFNLFGPVMTTCEWFFVALQYPEMCARILLFFLPNYMSYTYRTYILNLEIIKYVTVLGASRVNPSHPVCFPSH